MPGFNNSDMVYVQFNFCGLICVSRPGSLGLCFLSVTDSILDARLNVFLFYCGICLLASLDCSCLVRGSPFLLSSLRAVEALRQTTWIMKTRKKLGNIFWWITASVASLVISLSGGKGRISTPSNMWAGFLLTLIQLSSRGQSHKASASFPLAYSLSIRWWLSCQIETKGGYFSWPGCCPNPQCPDYCSLPSQQDGRAGRLATLWTRAEIG